MKKILPFFSCILCFCTLQAQTISNLWTPQAVGLLPAKHDIQSISIVNENIIWAIADTVWINPFPKTQTPKLLKTIDGGKTWQVINLAIAAGRYALDVHALDGSTAWITTQAIGNGLAHELFKTTDGGNTWQTQIGVSVYAASCYIRFFDTQNGIIWNRHALARTINGGRTWVTGTVVGGWVSSDGFQFASTPSSCVVIGDSIWAGTAESRIIFSPNKGYNWQFYNLQSIPNFGTTTAILSIAFKNAREGIALGSNASEKAFLVRTNDGGNSWTPLTTYPFSIGSAIEYVRGTDGAFFVTEYSGLTAYTKDFGQSWIKVDSLAGQSLRFLNAQTGWLGKSITETGGAAMYKWNGGNILSAIKVYEAEDIALKMSPNPTNRFLTIKYAADFKPSSLHIYDAMGKLVLAQKNLPISSQVIDLQDFTNGIYLVQLQNTEGVIAKKIVVGH